MKPIILLTALLMFVAIIAQAAPAAPDANDVKIGKNLHTTGVKFKDLYESIAQQSLKVHSQYNKLFASFNGDVKDAADKDNLPVPEFFGEWNDKYVSKAKEAHHIYKIFLKKLEKFGKTLDAAYHG